MITNLKQNVREPSFKLMKYILTQFCFHTSNINSKTSSLLNFFLPVSKAETKMKLACLINIVSKIS